MRHASLVYAKSHLSELVDAAEHRGESTLITVAVAAARPREVHHVAARARVERVLAGDDDIVVPAIFGIEVAAALARARVDPRDVTLYVNELLTGAAIVTIGPRRASRIQTLAAMTKLRAADAIYAWVAARANVPLVTLDEEVLARATCLVERP